MTRTWSIKEALAGTRSARTKARKAATRYGKRELVAHLIESAMADMTRAERKLCRAVAMALATSGKRRAAA